MIKGAIFDMDGTLVANSPVHIRAFEIFCDRYGVRGWKEKLGQAFGMGTTTSCGSSCPGRGDPRERIGGAWRREGGRLPRNLRTRNRTHAGTGRPAGQAPRCGHTLRRRSSGCRANVDFVLEKCDIESFFDAKINGDMVTRCKPDPEIYLTAAAALGLAPAEWRSFSKTPRRATSRHGGPARAASSRWRPRTPAKCWPPKPTPTSSSATSATSPTSKHC